MAKKQFKAESKRLLDLMINSIYTHKEIFPSFPKQVHISPFPTKLSLECPNAKKCLKKAKKCLHHPSPVTL